MVLPGISLTKLIGMAVIGFSAYGFKKVADLEEEEKEKIKAKFLEDIKKINDLATSITNSEKNRSSDKDGDVVTRNKKIEELTGEIKMLTTNYEVQDDSIKKIKTDIINLENQSQTTKQLIQDVKNHTIKISNLENKLNAYDEKFKNYDEKFAIIKPLLEKEKLDAIINVSDALGKLEAKINSMPGSEKYNELKNELNDLNNSIKITVSGLFNNFIETNEEYQNIKKKVSNIPIDFKYKDYSIDIDGVNTRITNISNNITDINARMRERIVEIDSINQKLNSFESQLASVKTKTSKIPDEYNYKDYTNEIKEINNELSKIRDNELAISKLKTKLDKIPDDFKYQNYENDIKNFDVAIKASANDIIEANKSIDKINKLLVDFPNITTKVNKIPNEFSYKDHTASIDSLNTSIAILNSNFNNLLTGKIAALENSIKKIPINLTSDTFTNIDKELAELKLSLATLKINKEALITEINKDFETKSSAKLSEMEKYIQNAKELVSKYTTNTKNITDDILRRVKLDIVKLGDANKLALNNQSIENKRELEKKKNALVTSMNATFQTYKNNSINEMLEWKNSTLAPFVDSLKDIKMNLTETQLSEMLKKLGVDPLTLQDLRSKIDQINSFKTKYENLLDKLNLQVSQGLDFNTLKSITDELKITAAEDKRTLENMSRTLKDDIDRKLDNNLAVTMEFKNQLNENVKNFTEYFDKRLDTLKIFRDSTMERLKLFDKYTEKDFKDLQEIIKLNLVNNFKRVTDTLDDLTKLDLTRNFKKIVDIVGNVITSEIVVCCHDYLLKTIFNLRNTSSQPFGMLIYETGKGDYFDTNSIKERVDDDLFEVITYNNKSRYKSYKLINKETGTIDDVIKLIQEHKDELGFGSTLTEYRPEPYYYNEETSGFDSVKITFPNNEKYIEPIIFKFVDGLYVKKLEVVSTGNIRIQANTAYFLMIRGRNRRDYIDIGVIKKLNQPGDVDQIVPYDTYKFHAQSRFYFPVTRFLYRNSKNKLDVSITNTQKSSDLSMVKFIYIIFLIVGLFAMLK